MIAQFAPIVLAFGANLHAREKTILSAQQELAAHSGISEFKSSGLYESAAVKPDGVDFAAPRYLNAVSTAVTTLKPLELLTLVHEIEAKYGRVRGKKWADRTLDIDIISYAGLVQRTQQLTLPHPHAHERDFVLSPWLEVDPHAVLLRHGRVRDLLQTIGNNTVPVRTNS